MTGQKNILEKDALQDIQMKLFKRKKIQTINQ